MIKFVGGDFFDYDADIRINTVNCVGVMGAGVALLFKNKYPNMFDEYFRACERNEVEPGKPHVWEENNMFSKCTIINFPTKIHWKNPSEYEYVEKGLVWLRQYLLERNNSTVTLPALGCGHGGLEWDKVKEMIIKYLSDVNSKIFVFEPSSSTTTSISEEINDKLKEQNIFRLLPNDKFFPKKLVGRSAQELFYKGNIELILDKSIAIVVNSKPEDRERNALLKLIDELPTTEFTFLIGMSNSYEIDIAKEILSKGFKAIIIVPYGILELKIRTDLQPIWNYENLLVISITTPNQTWKSYESLNSLKFRLKLSDITLINCLDFEKLSNLENDLKQSRNNLFYINYWNNQIDFFERLFAHKIGIKSDTRKPNILPLLDILNKIRQNA